MRSIIRGRMTKVRTYLLKSNKYYYALQNKDGFLMRLAYILDV
jgi:hypothetical protein